MSVIESLKPIYWTTYVFGVLPDWCAAFQRSLSSRIANGIGVGLTLANLTLVGLFQLCQLVSQIQTMVNIHSVVTNVLWFYGYPVSLMVQLHYVVHIGKYLDFFDSWNRLEHQPLILGHFPSHKWTHRCLVAVHLVLVVVSTAVTATLIFAGPETSVTMSSCQGLSQTIPAPLLGILQTISYGQCRTVGLLCDIVPGTVFYQAALSVESLEQDLHLKFDLIRATRLPSADRKRHFCFKKQLNDWWCQYVDLKRSVARANDLFGPVIALNDGLLFSVICCVTYSFLYNIHAGDASHLATMFFCLLVNGFRLVSSTLLASKLQRRARQLSATFTALACHNWQLLSDNEERLVEMVVSHLRDDVLVARPWDLYDLNDTFLLKALSIAATYVVILLQSK